MKIIEPYIEVISGLENPSEVYKKLERCGRTAYKSEDKITEDSAGPFIQKIVDHDHLSVLEHHSVTIRIICDRGVSHELVRHRIASYTQESTRYVDYSGDDILFIKPHFYEDSPGKAAIWTRAVENAERSYQALKACGPPQEARSVLPASVKTEIVATMNLREWLHFFNLRMDVKAHPDMRTIAEKIYKEFFNAFPEIYSSINIILSE